jgi:hypothetical protein
MKFTSLIVVAGCIAAIGVNAGAIPQRRGNNNNDNENEDEFDGMRDQPVNNERRASQGISVARDSCASASESASHSLFG